MKTYYLTYPQQNHTQIYPPQDSRKHHSFFKTAIKAIPLEMAGLIGAYGTFLHVSAHLRFVHRRSDVRHEHLGTALQIAAIVLASAYGVNKAADYVTGRDGEPPVYRQNRM